ncbi:excisionase [Rhizobium leguminosarum]|uniref:excisionase n=1 Tax=Rhizobium leguminosarum TaxID=384 RepID=UPI0018DCA65F|nr:excisionase [Rhizobium leguminosarum]
MADIDVSTLDPDTPLRLKLAASLAFPDGSMTESGLKREIERGRLECERIAGKTYVSLNDIKRMRELCRESRRGSANTSASEKGGRLSGSSSMAEMKSAQDAARMTALALIERSKSTLPRSINPNGAGANLRR